MWGGWCGQCVGLSGDREHLSKHARNDVAELSERFVWDTSVDGDGFGPCHPGQVVGGGDVPPLCVDQALPRQWVCQAG